MWAFVIVSVWYMVDALVNQPAPSLIALALAAAGIPFYLYWRAQAQKLPPTASKPA